MPNLVQDTCEREVTRLDGTFCSHSRTGAMHVVVVGGGALGNEAVRLLGHAGVGAVDVIDPDRVEPSNVTRSLFFRGRVGQPKAATLVESAQGFFPETRFRA